MHKFDVYAMYAMYGEIISQKAGRCIRETGRPGSRGVIREVDGGDGEEG